MSHSALRAQRKKEMDAAKEAAKLLQRESELQAAEKLKERLMAASLGRTNALRMTQQERDELGIGLEDYHHSVVAEGGRRSRRMRRVRRVRRVRRHRSHSVTRRRKHHVTRRSHSRSGRSKRGGGFSSDTLHKKYLEIENDPSASPKEKEAAYEKYKNAVYVESIKPIAAK